MKPSPRIISSLSAVFLLGACSAPSTMTVTVYEGENQVVRLLAMPDANEGRGYSHPAFLSEQTVATVLKGLIVEEETSLIALAFGGSSSGKRSRAFGDAEVKFLAPLLAKGLGMATPEELVTFYETAEISSTQRVVTSGGIFVLGDELHILLGNHITKVPIWQDNEEYEAPYRLRPLEPISPEPGRLVFEPPTHMVSVEQRSLTGRLTGTQLHAAVRYKDIPTRPTPTRP